MQCCDIHFHHNHHWRYCTIHYRFEADPEIGIPACAKNYKKFV